jgi:drug/metabolite transporter (DMT)-like permease
MIPLLLSICCSTYLVVLFRYFKNHHIDARQAIVANYITCVITGIIVSGDVPDAQIIYQDWFPITVFLGCSFYLIFNLMAFVSANIGITLTSVSGKISMVIPVTIAVYLYGQELTFLKVSAMILALFAVYLTSKVPEKNQQALHAKGLLLAFLIFIGSGINDAVINYAFFYFLHPAEFALFNISIFAIAATAGVFTLLVYSLFYKSTLSIKSIAGGILLGIPNYFSMLFLLKALAIPGWESSVIFPINNMGIVILTAICGLLLFREKFSKTNIAGILLALIAISLMIGAES